MCGIAGEVRSHDSASRDVVERQLGQLVHRGPDSSGCFVRGRGGIGQTRLAIIDLVSGDPPISTPDGTIGVALNGEIYNFAALRAELAGRGHLFRTAGDTEVLAHLAEDLEAVELARCLHGMFAFAVWDTVRDRLVLGRDRLGKKPLYWWCDGRTFVFGSELKAVLTHPDVPSELDEDAIPAYLCFGYVPTPRTFFRGVQSLPPGHVLTVDAALDVRLEPYWQPVVPGFGTTRIDLGPEEAAREVRRLLDRAVADRLVADVPVGAFLSGGVDSSAVVGLMAGHGPVQTFTIGFEDDQGYDERRWASMVAAHFGTDHTEFVVAPTAVDLVERLVWHHDQPFGDSSAIPTFLLSELTRGEVTVALCGDGGDELFAGYERFLAGTMLARAERLVTLVRPDALRRLPGLPPKAQRFLATAGAGMPDAYRQWVGFVSDSDIDDLVPGGARSAAAEYREAWQRSAGAAPLDRLLLLNLQTYLVDDLLPKVDRMSMAVGLEVRAPFLDHRLVEFALRLPPATKVRRGRLKRVLKDAVADIVPPQILERPKRGFGVPLDRWFREDLAGYVRSTLGHPDARVRSHLRSTAVDRLLAEHAAGVHDRGKELWTLLTLEVFLRGRGW